MCEPESKLIRVKYETFQELIKKAKWSDTMDAVIHRLLDEDGREE